MVGVVHACKYEAEAQLLKTLGSDIFLYIVDLTLVVLLLL